MPREAPDTRAMREARGRVMGSNSIVVPGTQGPIRRAGYDRGRRSCPISFEQLTPVVMGPCAGTTPWFCLTRLRQQRQLPRLRLGLGHVGERGGVVAGKAVIGEFGMRGVAAGLAHGA